MTIDLFVQIIKSLYYFAELSSNIIKESSSFFFILVDGYYIYSSPFFSQQRLIVYFRENSTNMTQFLKLAYLVVFSSIITLTTSQRNCRLTTADVEGPFYERSKH